VREWIIVTMKNGRVQMYANGVGMQPGASVDAAEVGKHVKAEPGTPGHFAMAAQLLEEKANAGAPAPAPAPAPAEESHIELGESADPVGEFLRRRRTTTTPGKFPEMDDAKYRLTTFNREDTKLGCQVGSSYGQRKIEITLPKMHKAGFPVIAVARLHISFMKLTVCKEKHCDVRKQVLSCKVEWMRGEVNAKQYALGLRPGTYENPVDCDVEARKAATAAC